MKTQSMTLLGLSKNLTDILNGCKISKSRLAKFLDVDIRTLSRWISMDALPNDENTEKIFALISLRDSYSKSFNQYELLRKDITNPEFDVYDFCKDGILDVVSIANDVLYQQSVNYEHILGGKKCEATYNMLNRLEQEFHFVHDYFSLQTFLVEYGCAEHVFPTLSRKGTEAACSRCFLSHDGVHLESDDLNIKLYADAIVIFAFDDEIHLTPNNISNIYTFGGFGLSHYGFIIEFEEGNHIEISYTLKDVT